MSPRGSHRLKASAAVRRRRTIVGAVAVAVVAAAVGGVLATSGSSPVAAHRKRSSTGSTTGSSTTTTPVQVASSRCPLTDLPAPGGVPNRPALGIKIGNEPEGARPQSGLNEADIVYDTPAEGFVMRYVAVYQCDNATSIGPTRSVRWVDWHILQQFGHPILAFAGGINPDVNTVTSLPWLHPADLLAGAQGAAVRTTNRVPPDNLYTSTSALYGLFKGVKGVPRSVFSYTASLPSAARPANSLAINFSFATDVLWKWDATAHDWLHTYSGVPDVDALTGKPVTTTNIFVQIVHYTYGPYIESPGSTGDVESQTVGSGSGFILRNGKAIAVTWHRPTLSDGTTFTDAAGQSVGLAPGRTWVELVPSGTYYHVGYTAAG